MRDSIGSPYARGLCAVLIAVALSAPAAASNSVIPSPGRHSASDRLLEPALPLNTSFRPIIGAGSGSACQAFRPPRLVNASRSQIRELSSSLIFDVVVGIDGRVEDLLIVHGGNAALHRQVEDTVQRWVYEPALCNGTPIEAEGRIQVHPSSGLQDTVTGNR